MSAFGGTVTPGGTTLAAMDASFVALHAVVYDLGSILNSTCAITEVSSILHKAGH